MKFKDKHILLGVTGSIAAYKAATLASHLAQAGALVDVILTEAGARFVAPLTFEALTGRPAYTDMWHPPGPTRIAHIGLAEPTCWSLRPSPPTRSPNSPPGWPTIC
jgi:phosphopantothenoylcysteine decarboxylase/phosphopantothenate--cysteine ligase